MRFERTQSALDALGAAVAVNVMLAATASPLIVLLVLTDAFATWPLVAIAAVIAMPGVSAAFTAFAAFGHSDVGSFRAFARRYRATWRRATVLALLVVAAGIVLLVDVRFFADGPYAQAAMVVLAVTGVLVAGIGLVALAAIAEDPGIRVREAVRRACWFGLQRWYLTLVSLGALAAYAAVFVSLPLLALTALAAPALYLAWANCRFTLRPVLDLGDARA